MTFPASETKVSQACTADGCTNTFGRSHSDSYNSRPLPEGWISGTRGWRCSLHHDYEITFDEAISNVESDHYAAEHEFGGFAGSDIDWDTTLRALRRGPLSPGLRDGETDD